MLHWNYLETFVVLSETLNFSITAKLLNTAQPVISRKIKLLEEELGYPLFIRSKKSVALSTQGQELKRKLKPLVEEIKKIFTEDEDLHGILKGTIRLGSMPEAGISLLQPKVAHFIEKNSQIKIHITLMSSAEANAQIMSGALDFGFVYQLSDRKSLRAFPVAHDMAVMIANRKTAVDWRSQEKYLIIGYREKDFYVTQFLERNLTKVEQKKIDYGSSINSHGSIIDLVKRQKAFAVIPRSSAQKAIDRGQIEVLIQDRKPQNLFLVCHEQTLIDKKKKKFLDYLLKEFNYQNS